MASPPFKVKAVYEYRSPHDDDLSFPNGQIITVTEEEDADWYVGEYVDPSGIKQEGLFPRNFVERYEPEVPSRPARTSRPKQQDATSSFPPQPEPEVEDVEEVVPHVPAASKPAPPPVESFAAPVSSAQTANPPAVSRPEPPPAPKPEPADPAEPSPARSEPAKKAPPPVAAKSNAFKDRIAAFNQGGAAPITPIAPGVKPGQSSGFVKKAFVAPPPSKNAYVPPIQKQEPVHKPYIREEDPEIRRRQEEDRQAAEAAGLAAGPGQSRQAEEEPGEDAPQPTSLKDRIALLQKQQMEQAQRRAEGGPREKRPKAPQKQPSQTSQPAEVEDEEELARQPTSTSIGRPSADRQRPPLPPEPLSPRPEAPDHEILSDGHEADQSGAGDTTDDAGTIGLDDSDERPMHPPVAALRATAAPRQEADVGEENDTTEGDEEEEEEEDSMDEETRRKEELRARMAKMSGGMGMGPMFNPFGAPPPSAPKKKKSTQESSKSRQAPAAEENVSEQPLQQRLPMMPMPGMGGLPTGHPLEPDLTPRGGGEQLDEYGPQLGRVRSPDEVPEAEDAKPDHMSRSSTSGAPPPVPKDRPVPLPPPAGAAGAPPIPSGHPRQASTDATAMPAAIPRAAGVLSPGPGSESDDELSMHKMRSSAETSGADTPLPILSGAPPVPVAREPPPLPTETPKGKRNSQLGNEPMSPTSDKRISRAPPPVPGQSPVTSPRPPPPPPPTQAPPTRASTDQYPANDDVTERGESDYEGDYDTDIASSAKHKDALKTPHVRDSSLDDSTTTDSGPPVSAGAAPRAVPPPPPPQASRPSMDAPRAPPPVPSAAPRPPRPLDEDDYDPYRYDSTKAAPPIPPAIPPMAAPGALDEAQDESSADELYEASPTGQTPRAQVRAAPPPPPASQDRTLPQSKQSIDVNRRVSTNRMSGDIGRSSTSNDLGQIARDVDLSESTQWWVAAQPLPPSLQQRNGIDILSESEESTTSKRGGKMTVSKDIYVLYMDYSQTIITARYDSKDPQDVSLAQRHEPSPARPRQDQLESYWQRYGARIGQEIHAHGHKKDPKPIGDGSPHGLIVELLKPFQDALRPVGTRAYGALIYMNLANASVQQFDEIRPGDVVTLRNAKFEGKHGMSKYKDDYGPQHVAVVDEWDGTKKKIRAWEQGRAKAKVREESFRLGDLRSGEVRVWRVVGREYVGWES